ncbi:hypothetical protein [Streptomyces sp. NPDC014734]|uniref:DUF7848 domain-containing protein n=1 Tax=Streptomyces sp. NPDC014734 TaxID=3364886 RepID=UPI0037015276
MSSRALFRYEDHTIQVHPDFPTWYSAHCRNCEWSAPPQMSSADVDRACMEHAGRSNHRRFERFARGEAFGTRAGES